MEVGTRASCCRRAGRSHSSRRTWRCRLGRGCASMGWSGPSGASHLLSRTAPVSPSCLTVSPPLLLSPSHRPLSASHHLISSHHPISSHLLPSPLLHPAPISFPPVSSNNPLNLPPSRLLIRRHLSLHQHGTPSSCSAAELNGSWGRVEGFEREAGRCCCPPLLPPPLHTHLLQQLPSPPQKQ